MNDPFKNASNIYQQGCELKKDPARLLDAYKCFKTAVFINPYEAPYHLNLALTCGDLMQQAEQIAQEGLEAAQEAVKLAPDVLGNWVGLAEIALRCYKFPEAIATLKYILERAPDEPNYWRLLGFAYQRDQKMGDAEHAFKRAVAIDPEYGDAHMLLSIIYDNPQFIDRAKQAYHAERAVLAKKQAHLKTEAMWNAAHGYLGVGDYEKGWKYYEARLTPNITTRGTIIPSYRFSRPMWKGEMWGIDGTTATVRIHTEQGYGDVFLMLRFLPAVIAIGVKVVLECQENVREFIESNFPTVRCIRYGTEVQGEPFDFHLPIMSLPLVLQKFSPCWEGSYLSANPINTAMWEKKLKLSADKPNIGICWSSGKNFLNASNYETFLRKSVPWNNAKRLMASAPDINFISLQVGNDEPFRNPGIKDFGDTAAIIENLDLVIACDSAVANLAGAMGKQVFLMDRYDHDWRWARGSAWYPQVFIFRQPTPDDWDSVIDEILSALSESRDKKAYAA